jgi:hypothetical protein
MIVTPGEGLEEIGPRAFYKFTSLYEIIIHPAVKAIKDEAFARCSQLMIVTLGEGLEEIGKKAFCEFTCFSASSSPALLKKFIRKHTVAASV